MHTPRVPGTTLLLAAAGWLAARPASGDVTPHRLFSDHAVLQRDVMLPVWGTASDGEKVTVEFAGQKVETVARDGRFRVDLAPLAASAAGRTLTFTGRNTVTVRDVLVGEVWLCSGQSNMEASMGWLHTFSPDRAAALAAVADPLVRIAGVPLRHVDEPAADVDMHWQPCDAESMVDFSAVAAFARLFDDAASDDRACPACLYNGMIAPPGRWPTARRSNTRAPRSTRWRSKATVPCCGSPTSAAGSWPTAFSTPPRPRSRATRSPHGATPCPSRPPCGMAGRAYPT